MQRLALVVTAIAMLSVACKDQRIVQPPPGAGPAYLISDGAHSGNAFFFFLPPLVPDPSAFFHAGTFNPNLSPVVDVCALNDDPQLHPAPPDPGAAHCVGNVFGPATMALDLMDEQYQLNWDTRASALVATNFYRIFVRGAPNGTALGFLDVDPVDQGMKNLRTAQVVQFQDGRTLPIKVRIENRAYCISSNTDCVAKTVGTAGGDVLAKFAGVRFFAGNLPGDRVVIIEEVLLTVGEKCLNSVIEEVSTPRTDLLEYPPCYQFRTDPGPTTFLTPTGIPLPTAAICPVLTALPTSLAGHRQLFQEEHSAGLQDANADFLPCTVPIGLRSGWRGLLARLLDFLRPRPAFAATAVIDLGAGGSTDGFSHFTNAVQSTIEPVSSTNQTATAGSVLPISVRLTAIHPAAEVAARLSSVPVTFTTSAGTVSARNGGLTNSDGLATADWTLPTTAGTYMLTASASAIGSPITFKVTATPPVTIDGLMSPGEWDGAATTPFTVNVPGGTTSGILFVMNDDRNLYLAVKFERSVVDNDNLLNFEFDNNNNGTGPETGDDYFTFTPANGFSDAYRSCGDGCSVITDRTDGAGAFRNDGKVSVYELSHPLNSGETGKDFALVPPTTIGVLLQMDVGTAHTRFPGGSFPTYVPISITGPPIL